MFEAPSTSLQRRRVERLRRRIEWLRHCRPAALAALLLILAVPLGAQPPAAAPAAPQPAAPQPAAPHPAAPQPAAPQPAAPAAAKGQRIQVSEEGLLHNIWWNQEEVIAKLGLKPEQRTAMDAHFRRFFAEHEAKQTLSQSSRTGFTEALQQGRWEDARRNVQGLGTASQALVIAQPTLKIDVLSLLTQEQLAVFTRDYSHLFERPWYRQVTIGGGADKAVQRKRSVQGERLRDRQAPAAQPAPPPGGNPKH